MLCKIDSMHGHVPEALSTVSCRHQKCVDEHLLYFIETLHLSRTKPHTKPLQYNPPPSPRETATSYFSSSSPPHATLWTTTGMACTHTIYTQHTLVMALFTVLIASTTGSSWRIVSGKPYVTRHP